MVVNDLTSYIKQYENVLSKADCETIIQLFDRDPTVYEGGIGKIDDQIKSEHRQCRELVLNDSALFKPYLHFILPKFITPIQRYIEEVVGPQSKLKFPPQYRYEGLRMKHYRASKGDKFDYHVDEYDAISCRRFLVAFIYLNDVEEGGETEFPELNVKIKPRSGNCLIFPPNWLYLHSGNPPISGDKYIMGTYLHYQ